MHLRPQESVWKVIDFLAEREMLVAGMLPAAFGDLAAEDLEFPKILSSITVNLLFSSIWLRFIDSFSCIFLIKM